MNDQTIRANEQQVFKKIMIKIVDIYRNLTVNNGSSILFAMIPAKLLT